MSAFGLPPGTRRADVDIGRCSSPRCRRESKREAELADYRLANERLYHAATRDPLTDCHNRRYFEETAESLLDRERRENCPVALMILDIDYFKKINDQHGHAMGDRALCHVVTVIRQYLRASDMLARFGGEEFAVLLPDVDGSMGWVVAERIRQGIAASNMLLPDGEMLSMTVSIGIAWVAATHMPKLAHLYHEADVALYEAKGGGRNRCVVVEFGKVLAERNPANDDQRAPLCPAHRAANDVSGHLVG